MSYVTFCYDSLGEMGHNPLEIKSIVLDFPNIAMQLSV